MTLAAPPRRAGAGTILRIVLVGVLWGLNWPAVKFMLTEIPPFTLRAVAFTGAGLIVAAIACARGERMRPPAAEWRWLVVTALVYVAGFNILTALGQMLTETSKAAIVAYTMPVMTAGLAAIFLGEALDWRRVAALALGVAGLAALASENFSALVAAPAGALLMLGAALSWSLGNIAVRSRDWVLPPLARTAWFFAISAPPAWALAFAFDAPFALPAPGAPVLLTMVFHIAGPMVVSYVLFTGLIGRLGASVAALTTLLAPIVGVVSSVILLGDPPTWTKALALALVAASILLTLSPARGGPRS